MDRKMFPEHPKVSNVLTPVKAIRAKCLECSNHHLKDIRGCLVTDCPLFPYRLGKNPNRKGIGNLKGRFTRKTQT